MDRGINAAKNTIILGGVKMKVDTIEQFKILEFLNTRLELDCFILTKVSRNIMKVTDKSGESIYFKYLNDKITWSDELEEDMLT